MNKVLDEIMTKYENSPKAKADVDECNASLKKAGMQFHLEPGKNEITKAELEQTVVGATPAQASGYGLLDTGTGSLEKVKVTKGKLASAVNALNPDGSVNMPAFVLILDKQYAVKVDTLV